MKKITLPTALLMACGWLSSHGVLASVESDLGALYQKYGVATNLTQPQVYQGQQAGYYTGGSVYARAPVHDYPLMTSQWPSLKGGCGGIDLFTGGFSFINSQQLVDAMKNIANNAVSYSFLLALETVSPLIKNQMQSLQEKADAINRLNIQSCETGVALVGAVWPKTEAASQQICASLGSNSNLFSDYTAARQDCGVDTKKQQALNKLKQQGYGDFIADNTNLAWKAIQTNAALKNDTALAELFLSLSGSLIVTNTSQNGLTVLPSLMEDPRLMQTLLHGGTTPVYRCNNTDCLSPTRSTMTITAQHALVPRVQVLIEKMLSHIQTDTALGEDEIALLNATRLPLYKMLSVEAAYYAQASVLNLSDYADVIALDWLYQYLHEQLTLIEIGSQTLQLPTELTQQFQQQLVKVKQRVQQLRMTSAQREQVATQLIEKTQRLEQQLLDGLVNEFTQPMRRH